MKIISVVGARPNFMKVAPLHRAFQERDAIAESLVVHTGQHYDQQMSDIFFDQLELPRPDRYLGVGSASHAQQTARVMTAFEEVAEEEEPDLVLVVGDVNSTLACSLVATKMHIPVAHVEAGLRSGDRDMPEEINRLLTDTIAELLFVTEQDGVDNLKAEGVPDDRIFFVGNVMIDSLVFFREKAARTGIVEELDLTLGRYAVMTMHRPSNVDSQEGLRRLLETIERIADLVPLVFPMHPRTRNRFDEFGLSDRLEAVEDLILLEPLGYLEFLRLMEEAGVVVTDSGGIQEETTFLQVPCLTLRDSTERPITIKQGTNELMDLDPEQVEKRVQNILSGDRPEGQIPKKWDGKAAKRIAKHIEDKLPVASA
ncbi:non-hydrolyzing UDP-N-acetylglucosamine 2-epimerase [Salinibacter ruber]|uniref:non-hydrolyzing UDP-N-acetylglucosamine 2-epimerase n=1 Tax=Salinibacter ruber TaxID=146919 RepID=UPI000E58425D|nr:UDP-N-acetylglucosamine 2-epimerase (non-hydrolyzing) [Salinibacter ruber]